MLAIASDASTSSRLTSQASRGCASLRRPLQRLPATTNRCISGDVCGNTIVCSHLVKIAKMAERSFLRIKCCRRWNNESESLVIDFHRGNRVLWDTKNPEYYNRQKRISLLQQLLEFLHMETGLKVSVVEVKKKWKNLRTTFQRELKRTKMCPTESGESGAYISKWCHYEEMLFLSELTMNETTDSLSYEPCSKVLIDLDGLPEDREESSSFDDTCPPTTSRNKPKKEDISLKILRNFNEMMQDISVKRSAEPKDGIAGFTQHVAATLRQMSNVQQQHAILDIQKILTKYITEQNT